MKSLSSSTRERRTDYVVLSMLLRGPGTGYAVRQRVAASVGNFWQESFGQLYPTLRDLTARGWVKRRETMTGRRPSAAYSLTPQGKAALTAWLARAPRPAPERNELLLKLFVFELAPEVVLRHLRAERARALRERDRLEAMAAQLEATLRGHPSLEAYLAAVEYGTAGLDALVAWCDRTVRRLSAKPPKKRRAGR